MRQSDFADIRRDPAENAVHEGSSLDGGDVTLLAQQELVEPAPVRRLIVPRGHSAWWGVDPSTVRLSVAYVTPDGARGVRTVPFARVEGPARLSEIYAQTRLFAVDAVEPAMGLPLPGSCWSSSRRGRWRTRT
jgi:hypothetical protein